MAFLDVGEIAGRIKILSENIKTKALDSSLQRCCLKLQTLAAAFRSRDVYDNNAMAHFNSPSFVSTSALLWLSASQ